MKKITISAAYRSLLLFIFSFSQALVWAQDSSASSSTPSTENTSKAVSSGEFVVQPWMWIAGAAVVLILLIVLFSGNSKKEKSVTRTTVIRETEIE